MQLKECAIVNWIHVGVHVSLPEIVQAFLLVPDTKDFYGDKFLDEYGSKQTAQPMPNIEFSLEWFFVFEINLIHFEKKNVLLTNPNMWFKKWP